MNNVAIGGPYARRFRPVDGGVLVDAVGFDGRVPADTAPNIRVVFSGSIKNLFR
jgi:hypothetical protein